MSRRSKRPTSGSGSGRPGGLGGDQVEGRRAVRELLGAGRRAVRGLALVKDAKPGPLITEILELAAKLQVPVERVSSAELVSRARTEAPQGVIARADAVVPVDADDLLRAPHPFLVALEGVTDPGNLGAVLRTAETAGATGMVLARHRSVRLTPAAVKAAAGAVEFLPIATVAGIPSFLEQARRAEVWTVGLDERSERLIDDLPVADGPVVLVFGAEGDGLSRLARTRCDVLVRIPMHGHLSSLNVSAAAAITCFQIARCRAARRG